MYCFLHDTIYESNETQNNVKYDCSWTVVKSIYPPSTNYLSLFIKTSKKPGILLAGADHLKAERYMYAVNNLK